MGTWDNPFQEVLRAKVGEMFRSVLLTRCGTEYGSPQPTFIYLLWAAFIGGLCTTCWNLKVFLNLMSKIPDGSEYKGGR